MTEVEMFILLFISFITYMTGYTMGKDKGLKELANAIEMFPKEKTSIDALRKYYDFERTILIWNKFYKKRKNRLPKKGSKEYHKILEEFDLYLKSKND